MRTKYYPHFSLANQVIIYLTSLPPGVEGEKNQRTQTKQLGTWSYTPDSGNKHMYFHYWEVGCVWKRRGESLRSSSLDLRGLDAPRAFPPPQWSSFTSFHPTSGLSLFFFTSWGCLSWEHSKDSRWNFPWQSGSGTLKQKQAQSWSPAITLVMKHHRTSKPKRIFQLGWQPGPNDIIK